MGRLENSIHINIIIENHQLDGGKAWDLRRILEGLILKTVYDFLEKDNGFFISGKGCWVDGEEEREWDDE